MSTADYPQPIPVVTATVVGFLPDDPSTIVVVQLAKPSDPTRPFVLPGGIFDYDRHSDPYQTAIEELREETGLVPLDRLHYFGVKWRRDDERSFRGVRTSHCNDHLFCGAVTGTPTPQDVEEVSGVLFVKLNHLALNSLGRGHEHVVRAYLKYREQGAGSVVMVREDGSFLTE